MLVNFVDNPALPWSRDQVTQAIFGTMGDYIKEASYGATWVTGDVTQWMTIALSTSVCQTTTLASLAQDAAKAAGWMPSSYSRLIYAFPRNMCGFGGASFIGGSPSQASGTRTPWIAATSRSGRTAPPPSTGTRST
jgi:hypothetical protein